jgi:transposase InsO family protein
MSSKSLRQEGDIKKGNAILREPKAMRFRLIEEHRDVFCAKTMCSVLDVSSRGLRAYRRRPASQRQRKDMVVLAHIKEQSRLSLCSYGRPRMTEELKELGLNVGHRRVGRLMRENGIRIERSKKYKVTTDSNHAFNIASNLLNRDFSADRPNQKWAGDISYVWTQEGWLYLAVILDLHSRRVIGWAVSNRMKRDLAIRALKMAIALRQPPKGCIHHTDRGSQYCSHDYQKILRQHGFEVSMSGKGNCYDNSAVETFFKTIKAELIWRRSWPTRRAAELAIFKYINGFYNPRRRHSALGWKSPLAFERKVA